MRSSSFVQTIEHYEGCRSPALVGAGQRVSLTGERLELEAELRVATGADRCMSGVT
jgi:hypothetical protein